MSAVVKFEHRHPAHRINFQELGLAIGGSSKIDLLVRNVDAFFREEDPHAAWIRSHGEIINFHSCNLKPCRVAVNPRNPLQSSAQRSAEPLAMIGEIDRGAD